MPRLLPFLLLFLSMTVWADAPPRWTDSAAEQYSVEERAAIGVEHLETDQDYDEAYPWFRSAANDGSAVASANLGWFHEEGHGVDQDGEKAVRWYGQAARNGAPRYSVHVAWLYMDGRLLPQDRERAEEWFRYGVEQDVPEASLALGSVLFADLLSGRESDGSETEALLLKALDAGQFQATRFLGRMYLNGLGVEQDIERGMAAVRLGAERGDPEMQTLLARLLLEGELTDANPVEANQWALLAVAAGDSEAKPIQRYLDEQLLDETERRDSRRAARRWAEERQAPMP